MIAGAASRTRPIRFNPWVVFDVIIGGGRLLGGAGAPPSRADALLPVETRLEAGPRVPAGGEPIGVTPGRALRPGG